MPDTKVKAAPDVEADGLAVEPLQGFWNRLTARFPEDQVEKLPKPLKARDEDRGRCQEGSRYSADGYYCGGWHARSVHLDYVGHAGITMRLNEVCTPAGWQWEPLATDEAGLPLTRGGEFWIRLGIRVPAKPAKGGASLDGDTGTWVWKIGVGDDFNGSGKQAISDALRNAAMRFGIATYLWSKSEAAADHAAANDTPPPVDKRPAAKALWAKAQGTTLFDDIRAVWAEASARGLLTVEIEHMDGSHEPLGDALRRYGDTLNTQGA